MAVVVDQFVAEDAVLHPVEECEPRADGILLAKLGDGPVHLLQDIPVQLGMMLESREIHGLEHLFFREEMSGKRRGEFLANGNELLSAPPKPQAERCFAKAQDDNVPRAPRYRRFFALALGGASGLAGAAVAPPGFRSLVSGGMGQWRLNSSSLAR